MRQLDSLRAIAVFGVFVEHWLPARVSVLPWGDLGVQLFFVLSGFLITGILLDLRENVQSGKYSVRFALRQFYARRFLRIFPLFYATLAVGFLVGLPNIRDSLPWHVAYGSNFYVAYIKDWPGEAAHFWSLAAEEQFYIIWPCVILLLSRRLLRPLFAVMIFVSFGWRLAGAGLRIDSHVLEALPINTLDHFAFGATLAFLHHERIFETGRHILVNRALVTFALLCLVPGALCRLAGVHTIDVAGIGVNVPIHWDRLVVPTMAGILFFNLIHRTSRGWEGAPGRLLDNPMLLKAGRISYGLYLLHLPLVATANLVVTRYDWGDIAPPSVAWFIPKIALTVAVAYVSWHLFERPLNGLKRYFPY